MDKGNKPDLPELEDPEPIDVDEPAKESRCLQFGYGNPNIERCYYENTSKEELVLEHVIEYEHQFKVIYDPFRELFIAPQNEREIRKFICTTLRPTKLPYVELYEWDRCAKFIADYLEYEEIPEPCSFPQFLPSPANVLTWQAGDCCDFAVALCSLLIGVGYDAFVVLGTAPKKITTKDESLMECPFDIDLPDNESDDDPYVDADEALMEVEKKDTLTKVDDFEVSQKPEPVSKFDARVKEKQDQEKERQRILDEEIDDDEPDFEKEDEFGRKRKHAWVFMQKGKRDLGEAFFIEPSTGRKYSIEESPYFTVEAIFNHKNYYINMEVERPIQEIEFDIENDNSGQWEFVMMNQDDKKGDEDEENEDEDEDGDDDGPGGDEEVLDMPPPWSPKLFVNREKFIELCPKGEKTVFYKKCKVEFFSDCKQVDGLVKKLTLYEDFKRLITKEVRCYYKCRQDQLIMRRRFPYQFKTIEHYGSPGKQNSINYLKKLIQVDDQYRKMWYYHHRVKDNLIYREEQFGRKTFERFKNHPEGLIYQSVTYDPEVVFDHNQGHQAIEDKQYGRTYYVKKMAQKYELRPNKPPEEQKRKLEFNFAADGGKGVIKIFYHYKEGQIYKKPQVISRLDVVSQSKMGEMNEKESDKDSQMNQQQQFFNSIKEMEQKCFSSVKNHQTASENERENRKEFEKKIRLLRQQNNNPAQQAQYQEEIFKRVLEKTIEQKARDKMKQGKPKDADEQEEEKQKDYLMPILKKLALEDVGTLDEEAAIMVKNEALKNLKERLLTRAEIIQSRLQEEQEKLERAFMDLKKKGEQMTAEDEQKYDNQIHKANFRIDILTERASQHYRTSLRKFEQLDDTLMADPRLKVLHEKRNKN